MRMRGDTAGRFPACDHAQARLSLNEAICETSKRYFDNDERLQSSHTTHKNSVLYAQNSPSIHHIITTVLYTTRVSTKGLPAVHLVNNSDCTIIMKIIITGATGRIGGMVLQSALSNPAITTVVVLSRRDVGVQHAKLRTIIKKDYTLYTSEELSQLEGAEACIWYVLPVLQSVGSSSDTS